MSRSIGHKDAKLRREIRSRPCLICGRLGCDPHHVIRVGQGGRDTPDNLVPLCRIHHSQLHDGDHNIIRLVEEAAPIYWKGL